MKMVVLPAFLNPDPVILVHSLHEDDHREQGQSSGPARGHGHNMSTYSVVVPRLDPVLTPELIGRVLALFL